MRAKDRIRYVKEADRRKDFKISEDKARYVIRMRAKTGVGRHPIAHTK